MAERKLDSESLWQYALRVLSARAASTGELREKLLRRAERREDVEPILSRLKDYGYLNDRRFAESFSAARLEGQGFGKERVVRDLRKRRVAKPVAENAVRETYGETDEAQLIENFLRRKYRNVNLETYLAEPKNLASAYRRLRTAGFQAGNVISALRKFAREPELLDSMEPAEGDTGREAGN